LAGVWIEPPGASSLDLGEDDRRAVVEDQIELARAAAAVVARQQAEAEPLVVFEGETLSGDSELLAAVDGHAIDRTPRLPRRG
jgi:hypothetical protein